MGIRQPLLWLERSQLRCIAVREKCQQHNVVEVEMLMKESQFGIDDGSETFQSEFETI